MKISRWLAVCLALLCIGVAGWIAMVVFLSGARSSDAVLDDLALLTPLGSSVPAVEAAIRQRHMDAGMCWSEDNDGKKSSITVRYSDNYAWRIPPERNIIEAHWHFDPAGKLNDISLDYYRTSVFASTKENKEPISLAGRVHK
jgi:hypothetical protein